MGKKDKDPNTQRHIRNKPKDPPIKKNCDELIKRLIDDRKGNK